jgi:fumarylacetoacetase
MSAMNEINGTHAPELSSWISSANSPETDFPIQNLPFGVFTRHGGDGVARIGVAIGDQILDLARCEREGLLDCIDLQTAATLAATSLNRLMGLGADHWSELRRRLSELLREDYAELRDDDQLRARVLVPMTLADLRMPVEVGDYTDFYASIYHATNVGSMFRPDNPLLPNYKYLPVGYHGRASSVVVSGTPVRRPCGQTTSNESSPPDFGPCKLLDYELEVGSFIGPGNPPGQRIAIGDAEAHIFGLCLVNDWSARDIQRWEYQPLGPFLAKSFATSISPWVVTLEALAPFRAPAFVRPGGDPAPLPHLLSNADQQQGNIDLTLEVSLLSERMRTQGMEPEFLSRGNFKDMYWTIAQMVAHHSSNGCNLRAGDLIASGTVSGPTRESRGSLLELAWRGTEPIALKSGESRRFLEDGDEVIFRGYCAREGWRRIGFGECRGVITPAYLGD